MKKLAILLTFLLASSAHGFQLSITDKPDGTRVVNHNDSDWVKTSRADKYSVLVDVDSAGAGKKKQVVEFHSMTLFDQPEEYKGFPYKIKRIYTYGAMSCAQSSLMILVDLYVDSDNVIRYTQAHQTGSYIVQMDDTRVRKEILSTVCGDTI
jgi:hypothetical protein